MEQYNMYSKQPYESETRIVLTQKMLENIYMHILTGTVSELSGLTGLSYDLIYNLVHGRIHSISAEEYRIIFGEDPPLQRPKRLDGEYFRGMVDLWLFLEDRATKADLYREFLSLKKAVKIDYRIFSGRTKTVPTGLVELMEKKFFDQGMDRREIEDWLKEFSRYGDEERVSFDKIQPVLDFLKETLHVNPSLILKQWIARYESGELRTIPKNVYDVALDFKKRAEEALNSGSRWEVERLREEIYGEREGLTLFAEIEEELSFLKKHAGKSPRTYLGRSMNVYRRSKLKRIASWRAEIIRKDSDELVGKMPDIPVLSLPRSYWKEKIAAFISTVKSYLDSRIRGELGFQSERSILEPSRYRKAYESMEYGFIGFDEAPEDLGMSKKAFDFLVSKHSDIFREIASYEEKWYLPELYLKEIREKDGFPLMVMKYELLAREESLV